MRTAIIQERVQPEGAVVAAAVVVEDDAKARSRKKARVKSGFPRHPTMKKGTVGRYSEPIETPLSL